MKMINKNNQDGKTMLETILVLGIIATISYGIFATIGAVVGQVREARSISDFRTLVDAIHDRYASDGIYTDLSAASLIEDLAVPSKMIREGKIVDSEGKEMLVGVGANDYLFNIAMTNVSKEACVDYLGIPWYAEGGANIEAIYLNLSGASPRTYTWPVDDTFDSTMHLPITMGEIAASCQETNTISWEFN